MGQVPKTMNDYVCTLNDDEDTTINTTNTQALVVPEAAKVQVYYQVKWEMRILAIMHLCRWLTWMILFRSIVNNYIVICMYSIFFTVHYKDFWFQNTVHYIKVSNIEGLGFKTLSIINVSIIEGHGFKILSIVKGSLVSTTGGFGFRKKNYPLYTDFHYKGGHYRGTLTVCTS